MIKYEDLSTSNAQFFSGFLEAFDKMLHKGQFVLGENVSLFEKEFATYHQKKYCVGLNSGLDALTFGLSALELPKGSEVLVPSNTYIATILAIIHCGFRPLLVDPDIKTYNIDPKLITKKITAKTKAIMLVHLYGKMCHMDEVLAIAQQHDLKVIEDCAQAHNAKYRGKLAGTWGDIGAFSFYPTKNLGALGDGGAILTDNEEYADKVRKLRNYGSKIKYYNDVVGYNSRLDELQAAFLRIKLQQLGELTEHKRKLAQVYHERIKDKFIKPVVEDGFYDVYHIYNIRNAKRDQLKKYLLDNDVITEIHYPVSPNKQKAMVGICDDQPCPVSEEIHATTLSLPISYGNTMEEIHAVVDVLNRF